MPLMVAMGRGCPKGDWRWGVGFGFAHRAGRFALLGNISDMEKCLCILK